ncbi:hypothetical protein ACSQ8I_10255 [Marinovum sp. E06]|uniref:hypothetical protein n=1 Tax=Marinovum sp. E06 TaxID=3449225 RepID=UPI003EDB9721
MSLLAPAGAALRRPGRAGERCGVGRLAAYDLAGAVWCQFGRRRRLERGNARHLRRGQDIGALCHHGRNLWRRVRHCILRRLSRERPGGHIGKGIAQAHLGGTAAAFGHGLTRGGQRQGDGSMGEARK